MADRHGGVEKGSGDEGFVGGDEGPDPLVWWVDLACEVAFGSVALAAVPDHVPGVLGVGQDFADGGLGPGADGSPSEAGDGLWWRVAVEVGVEPVGDVLEAEAFEAPPLVDLGDDWAADGVGDQPGLHL